METRERSNNHEPYSIQDFFHYMNAFTQAQLLIMLELLYKESVDKLSVNYEEQEVKDGVP